MLGSFVFGSVHLGRLPLAAVDAVASYRRGMYGPPPESTNWVGPVLIACSILAAVWLGVWLYDRHNRRQRAAAKQDRSLFGDLCSAHGLTAEQRTYLEAAARQHQVDPAIAIFIRPEVTEPLTRTGSKTALWQSIHQKIYA